MTNTKTIAETISEKELSQRRIMMGNKTIFCKSRAIKVSADIACNKNEN